MTPGRQLDIFILTYGRLELLQACYQSVLTALPAKAGVIILVNGDDEATETWLASLRHPALVWFKIPREPRSSARNRAFHLSSAEVVYFLDDDVLVPEHLFKDCWEAFSRDPQLFLLGGPNLTPPDAALPEQAYGAVMTSWFAAPMIRMRYGGIAVEQKLATERDLMLCNLAVRRSRRPAGLYFPGRISSNEENLFLYQSTRLGLKALFRKHQYVFHHRRATLLSFARQIFSYGVGRAEQTWLAPRSLHPAFLVPLVSFLVGAALLTEPSGSQQLYRLAGVYAALALFAAQSAQAARSRGRLFSLWITLLTPVVHAAYALGWVKGLLATVWPLPGRRAQPNSFLRVGLGAGSFFSFFSAC